MPKGISGDDKRWNEESDARALAEAETIKADKKRMAGARRGAGRLAKEKQTEADALAKFSNQRKKRNKKAARKVRKKK